jgi:hypothetical protein
MITLVGDITSIESSFKGVILRLMTTVVSTCVVCMYFRSHMANTRESQLCGKKWNYVLQAGHAED